MKRFWIIKNTFKVHPFYYVCAFIACVTGNFRSFLIFNLIIFVHECGHLLASLYFDWNIEEVLLLPFGGVTIFNEDINRPLKEEFIILIMGPLLQMVFSFFLNDMSYSLSILFFNLLPIYPLDGSKFLNIILNKFLSFKKSHLVTVYVSFLTLLIFVVKVRFNLIFLLILSFVLYRVVYELQNHRFIFNKFLLERYVKRYNFRKEKVIYNEKDMMRDYRHIIRCDSGYITEREMLKKRFDFKGKT